MNEFATPKGVKIVRVELSKLYTAAEAAEVGKGIAADGKFHGLRMMVVMLPGTEVPAEAREVMSKMSREALEGAAVVVPSAPLRIFASFITRVMGLKSVTLHPTEAEAVAALDQRN
ncbi:MAG: hypothetical protein JNK82_17110 [Myxococcaceae bacterium]|nr:hypothetical protein [Myxococcaceae bacterium]